MATNTENKEEWEGPPLDVEEENSNNPELKSPAEEHGTNDVVHNESHDVVDTEGGAGKESSEQTKDQPDTPVGESSKPAENQPEEQPKNSASSRSGSRVRSKSRPQSAQRPTPSRGNSNMSTEQKDTATRTAPSKPQKSQPLPSVYEDKDASEKGQLVKRNRRRNKKSGYESSSTEDMPLRERKQPPQQQQMQPAQQQQMMQPEPPKKNDPMKLRLDLNLEIEVELKARIHGDLTLALFS